MPGWHVHSKLTRKLQMNSSGLQVRDVYERAISNIPPANKKRYWQRYIYLWINYALFEEIEAEDFDRTREVYRACLKLIPHKIFTFAKVNTPRHNMRVSNRN